MFTHTNMYIHVAITIDKNSYLCHHRKKLKRGPLLYVHLNFAVSLALALLVLLVGLGTATPVRVSVFHWLASMFSFGEHMHLQLHVTLHLVHNAISASHRRMCLFVLIIHVCIWQWSFVKTTKRFLLNFLKCIQCLLVCYVYAVALWCGSWVTALPVLERILLDASRSYHAVPNGGQGFWRSSRKVVLSPSTGMGWAGIVMYPRMYLAQNIVCLL